MLLRHAARDRLIGVIPHLPLRLCHRFGRCTKHSSELAGAERHGSQVIKRRGVQADFLGLVDVQVAADGLDRHDFGLALVGEAQDDERAELPGVSTRAKRHDLDRYPALLACLGQGL